MKAADARRAEKKLDVDARGFHALLWLVYGYAQQGRYDEARGVLEQIEAAAKESGSERTRSHLALARAAWLIETRKWGEAKAAVMSTGLPKDAAIADLFAIGFAAIRLATALLAARALQQMAALMESDPGQPGACEAGASGAGSKPAGAGRDADWPAPVPRGRHHPRDTARTAPTLGAPGAPAVARG